MRLKNLNTYHSLLSLCESMSCCVEKDGMSEDSDSDWVFSLQESGTCQAGRIAGRLLLTDWFDTPEFREAIMPSGANKETVAPPPSGAAPAAGAPDAKRARTETGAGGSGKDRMELFDDLCSAIWVGSEEDSGDEVVVTGKKVFLVGSLGRGSIFFPNPSQI